MARQSTPLVKKIFVVTDDEKFGKYALDALSVISEYSTKLETTHRFLAGDNPLHASDLVILDIDSGQNLGDRRLYDARWAMDPATALVIVSHNLDANLLRQVVKLGGLDWLQKPLARGDLLEVVTRSFEQGGTNVARVVAFVSAVGGSGASVMSINAAYLASVGSKGKGRLPYRCVLFDLDFSSGACGQFLDIANDYNFKDVLENPTRIDTEFIDILRKEHSSGFSLLSVKAPSLLLHPAGSETVLRILDVLAYEYELVILDIPYYDTQWKEAVLGGANEVIIVTNPTIPALRQARDLDRHLAEIRADGGVKVIANKYRQKLFSRDLARKEVQRVFQRRSVDFLPEAGDLMTEAANRGVIPIELEPRSSYSKKLRGLLGEVGF